MSIYWYNAAITSSMRLYYETMGPFAKPNNRFTGYVRVRPKTLYPCFNTPSYHSTSYAVVAPLLYLPMAAPRTFANMQATDGSCQVRACMGVSPRGERLPRCGVALSPWAAEVSGVA